MIRFIISAERANLTDAENAQRTAALRAALADIASEGRWFNVDVRATRGYFREEGQDLGRIEKSFVVTAYCSVDAGADIFSAMHGLMCRFEQDCFLYHTDNGVYLMGNDWTQNIGKRLKLVVMGTDAEACRKYSAWTYAGFSNYWIVE